MRARITSLTRQHSIAPASHAHDIEAFAVEGDLSIDVIKKPTELVGHEHRWEADRLGPIAAVVAGEDEQRLTTGIAFLPAEIAVDECPVRGKCVITVG